MIGSVIVMEPSAYQAWLSGTAPTCRLVLSGEKLFAEKQCNTCHGQRAPTLAGLYGSACHAESMDRASIADENYLRESILQPERQDGRRLSPDHAHVPGTTD